jgi:hypothetical protein
MPSMCAMTHGIRNSGRMWVQVGTRLPLQAAGNLKVLGMALGGDCRQSTKLLIYNALELLTLSIARLVLWRIDCEQTG